MCGCTAGIWIESPADLAGIASGTSPEMEQLGYPLERQTRYVVRATSDCLWRLGDSLRISLRLLSRPSPACFVQHALKCLRLDH